MEKSNLTIIADNPILFQELKDVMLKQFNLDDISTSLADESLGQVVRARLDGRKLVEGAFKAIEQCKTTEQKKEEPAPFR